jgi:PAS domain S-box-containing protein
MEPKRSGVRRRQDLNTRPATQAARDTRAPREDANQRFRLLFEHNLVGIYRTTLAGEIVDCNHPFAAMLGYRSRRELFQHRAQDLYFAPADRAVFLRKLRKSGMLMNSELRLRRKDGTPVYILENVLLGRDRRGARAIIEGTAVDITERKQAEDALRQSAQRYRELAESLRRLSQHLQTVRDEERARIARELHDELGQALTALNLDLHWLRDRLGDAPAGTRARLASMSALVNTTLQAVHRICADLRPALLDELGLSAAIEWHARDFQARTGVPCTLSLPRSRLSLPANVATAVFRVCQEGLTNVTRHARATRVRITLSNRAGTLTLRVHDNGVGFAGESAAGANMHGLIGMRERAVRWGGHLDVRSRPGQGTTVTLRLPTAPVRTRRKR